MPNLPSLYTSPCWNPYINHKNGKEVKSIKFFKDGEILASVRWFSGAISSNNRYPEVNLPTELKVKRTEDLNLKFCFLFDGSIYIPAELVNFRDNGEKLDFECDRYTAYKSTFSFEIEAVGIVTLNEFGNVVHTKNEMQTLTITEKYKHRYEDKPTFILAGEIEEIIKKENIKISKYDIVKMMKIYNFSKI